MTAAIAGPPIAQGRTAEIFAWDEGRVLKLFRREFSGPSIDQEAANTRRAYEAGLPVPRVDQVVAVDGRRGIIFERIDGRTLFEEMMARPWTVGAAGRLLARLTERIVGEEPSLLAIIRSAAPGRAAT